MSAEFTQTLRRFPYDENKNIQKRQTIINVAIRTNTEVYEPTIPNYSEN